MCVRVCECVCLTALAVLPTVTDLDHLLLLLYVANDVLQNGRRRGAEVFHELFKQPLKEVFKLVRWVGRGWGRGWGMEGKGRGMGGEGWGMGESSVGEREGMGEWGIV